MRIFCPECFELMPEDSHLPYVCKCTQAIFTTKQNWLVPKKKQRASELRSGKDVRVKNAKQKLNEKHRRLWRALHLHRECDRNWYQTWRNQLLKAKCKCAAHFLELEAAHPLSFDSEQAFFESTIDMHNAVNQGLDRPLCSMERAYMLWRHKRPRTDRSRCIVSVAVGDDMIEISKVTWPRMQAYADRCGADFIGLDNQTEDWWGLEKFRTEHFAKQYEETLFLDADCVINNDIPVVFENCLEDICIYDEMARYATREWISKERALVSARSKVSIRDTAVSFNSGVVLSRKSASGIWSRPITDIGTTHCAEQIWVGKNIDNASKNGVSVGFLDAKWNWQWWFKDFTEGLEKAYIVHFSSAPRRLEAIQGYIAKQKNSNNKTV